MHRSQTLQQTLTVRKRCHCRSFQPSPIHIDASSRRRPDAGRSPVFTVRPEPGCSFPCRHRPSGQTTNNSLHKVTLTRCYLLVALSHCFSVTYSQQLWVCTYITMSRNVSRKTNNNWLVSSCQSVRWCGKTEHHACMETAKALPLWGRIYFSVLSVRRSQISNKNLIYQ